MEPETILIATGNQGKKQEMLEFFQDLPFEFLSLRDFPAIKEPEETGKTFEENARQKSLFYSKKFGLPTLAEDSGLILSAFPGKFGLRTRRELEAKTDEGWLEQFLDLLKNEKNRKATFYSAIAFYFQDVSEVFLGYTSGIITPKPQAKIEKGIPVSSVFIPEGSDMVFSAMNKIQKNKVSHRGKAAEMMKCFLKTRFSAV